MFMPLSTYFPKVFCFLKIKSKTFCAIYSNYSRRHFLIFTFLNKEWKINFVVIYASFHILKIFMIFFHKLIQLHEIIFFQIFGLLKTFEKWTSRGKSKTFHNLRETDVFNFFFLCLSQNILQNFNELWELNKGKSRINGNYQVQQILEDGQDRKLKVWKSSRGSKYENQSNWKRILSTKIFNKKSPKIYFCFNCKKNFLLSQSLRNWVRIGIF